MKRTQIQLPDRLYERLKAQASYEESTLAELMRKAGEYYLSVNPSRESRSRPWIPPLTQARRSIFETRLALTLRHHGVTLFASSNEKHSGDFGFERVWNPLQGHS